MHFRFCCTTFLCLTFFNLAGWSAEAGTDRSDLDRLKQCVRKNEMREACRLAVGSSPPADWAAYNCLNRWGCNPYLKYGEAKLDFFRNRLALHLQLSDVAIESALDMLKHAKLEGFDLPGSTNLDYGNAFIAAAEASKVAARDGQFSQSLELLVGLREILPAPRDGYPESPVKPLLTNAIAALLNFTNAPTEVAARIRMAKDYWVGFSNWAVPPDPEQALKLLESDSHAAGTRAEALSLHYAAIEVAQSAGKDDVAERHLADLEKSLPAEADLADAFHGHARFHFSRGEFQKSKGWLLRINGLGTNHTTAVIHLGLAEVYEKLQDEPEMLRHLELAAHAPATDTHRSLMDASDTQQTALVRLGRHHQRKGDAAKALEYFNAWRPRSWCGNDAAQFAWERDFSIAQCLLTLGKTNEALENHLLPHLRNGGRLYSCSNIPKLVVRIFEERAALTELRQKLTVTNSASSKIAVTLAEIRLLRMDGNADALAEHLKDNGQWAGWIGDDFIRESNWRAVAAAEALAELDGNQIIAIEKRISALPYADRRWAAYALGLSGRPEGKALLEKLGDSKTLEMREVKYSMDLCDQVSSNKSPKK